MYVCGDHASLADAAAACAREQVPLAVVAGGDGTLSMTLTALFKAYGAQPLPSMVSLRAGTMNTVPNGLGLRGGAPERLLQSLIRRLDGSADMATIRCDTMDVGGRLGFLSGAGVVRGFLDAYYEAGNGQPNRWTAFTTLGRAAASAVTGGPMIQRIAKRLRATVTVDGIPIDRDDFLTLAAGTVPQIGLGFRPFYRTDQASGGFHFLGIHGSARTFLSRLPRIRRGRPLGEDCAHEALAREVLITPSEGTLEFMVDGDLAEQAGVLRISAGPSVTLVDPWRPL